LDNAFDREQVSVIDLLILELLLVLLLRCQVREVISMLTVSLVEQLVDIDNQTSHLLLVNITLVSKI